MTYQINTDEHRKNFRIGRCNHCPDRMAFAWPTDSGLRLNDMRCPRCSRLLYATSRDVKRLVR